MSVTGKNEFFLHLQVNFCPWVMGLFSIKKQRQHRKLSDSYRFVFSFSIKTFCIFPSWFSANTCSLSQRFYPSIVTWMVISYS